MRTTIKSTIVALLIALSSLFTSCEKDDNYDPYADQYPRMILGTWKESHWESLLPYKGSYAWGLTPLNQHEPNGEGSGEAEVITFTMNSHAITGNKLRHNGKNYILKLSLPDTLRLLHPTQDKPVYPEKHRLFIRRK